MHDTKVHQYLFPFVRQQKVGFINQFGEVIVSPKFDGDFHHGLGTGRDDLYVVQLDQKFGVINALGEYVIEPIYDINYNSFNFYGGCIAPCFLDGKAGFIDDTGRVVDFCYDYADVFSDGVAVVRQDEKCFIINDRAEILSSRYSYIDTSSEGLLAFKDNGKWGYLNTKGQVVIPAVHGFAIDFNAGWARIGSHDSESIYFINQQGETVLTVNNHFVYPFINGHAVIRTTDFGLYGLIDKTGKICLEMTYQDVDFCCDGKRLIVAKSISDECCCDTGCFGECTLRYGIISLDGQIVLPIHYEIIIENANGWFLIKEQGCYGWLDQDFRQVIESKYQEVHHGFIQGLALVELDGKTGYINQQAQWVYDYDNI